LQSKKSGDAIAEKMIALKELITSEMQKRLIFIVKNGRETY
jgi:hypothetical protein